MLSVAKQCRTIFTTEKAILVNNVEQKCIWFDGKRSKLCRYLKIVTWPLHIHTTTVPVFYYIVSIFPARIAIYQQLSNGIKLSQSHQRQSTTYTQIQCKSWSFQLNYWNDCFRVYWTFAIFQLSLNQLWTMRDWMSAERGKESLASGTHVHSINDIVASASWTMICFTITLNLFVRLKCMLSIENWVWIVELRKICWKCERFTGKTTNWPFDFTTNHMNCALQCFHFKANIFVSTFKRLFPTQLIAS